MNGTPLASRQMVAVLRSSGLDFTTLGNHELDLGREVLGGPDWRTGGLVPGK